MKKVSDSPDPIDRPHTRHVDLFCVEPVFATERALAACSVLIYWPRYTDQL
jgi:hypothetical protein